MKIDLYFVHILSRWSRRLLNVVSLTSKEITSWLLQKLYIKLVYVITIYIWRIFSKQMFSLLYWITNLVLVKKIWLLQLLELNPTEHFRGFFLFWSCGCKGGPIHNYQIRLLRLLVTSYLVGEIGGYSDISLLSLIDV